MAPQPLVCVSDVAASSDFYATLLGGVSDHGGDEYDRITVDGTLVLQLHALDEGHHHGRMADPAKPLGNGVAVWFQTDTAAAFDAAAARVHASGAPLDHDVHRNPNSGNREIWLRDPDGYLVVLAGR